MATLYLLLLLLLLLTHTQPSSSASSAVQPLWCVAKNNAEDTALEQALNWACGPGGADCGPIQLGGSCYDTNDLLGMASFAFNTYCLNNGMTGDACNFSNTAALTSLDPSHDGCKFPSSSTNVVNGTGSSSTASGVDSGSIADLSSSTTRANTEVWTPVLALLFVLVTIPAAINAR